jgi:hypothetical protein
MMTIFNSKWTVAILALLCLLLVLYFLGRKTFHTEITIPADPEIVWSVLMDATGYKDWNPLLVPIEGNLKEGEKLKYRMTQPNGKQSVLTSRVIKLIEHKELNQYGGIPGILTFDHKYLLEPVDEGTRVTQHEIDRGIGILFWNASWVQPTYRKVVEALRDRVMHLKNKN